MVYYRYDLEPEPKHTCPSKAQGTEALPVVLIVAQLGLIIPGRHRTASTGVSLVGGSEGVGGVKQAGLRASEETPSSR